MPFVRGLIDRILLVAAFVAGGLLPGFIAQYRQRLGGRLDQARIDLAPWQSIANQYHHGDLQALIQYHLGNQDPTFHSEGAAIQALVASVQRLQAAVDALQGSLAHQMAYLALHADPGLARATFNDWVPAFALSAEGLVFAVGFALVAWLLFHSLWRLFAWVALRWQLRTPATRH
jgi:hypothetical protein